MPDILHTKLFIPPLRPEWVRRERLTSRLDEGLHRKLTLVSAPAGFGKSTLLSEWVLAGQSNGTGSGRDKPYFTWLSLDERDRDPARFVAYLIAALNQIEGIEASFGKETVNVLYSQKPPAMDALLTSLINEMLTVSNKIVIILDDYHKVDSRAVDEGLTFLLEHLPPDIHLVIATREDPQIALAGLRARDQLCELRAADLRFTPQEAADFLNRVMALKLSSNEVAQLEDRTEGWIAGLQLAAISMRGNPDVSGFIRSFKGSHHFILDYLIEEVLDHLSAEVHTFLLSTSILNQMTGSLCDALTERSDGQETLEMLHRSNLFVVPLDQERRWYRYHHLFGDLLRRRLSIEVKEERSDPAWDVEQLHIRASQWFEDKGQAIEAFLHAAKANDIDRSIRLIEGGGMPLTFRGALNPILNWLESLLPETMDETPLLWVTWASAELGTGSTSGVEERLQAAEKVLQSAEKNDVNRDIIGRIAATRATVAWGQDEADEIIKQSERALEYLHPENLPFRTSTAWKLASAYYLKGDREAAIAAYHKTIATCEASGNLFIHILALNGLGGIRVEDNQLHQAAETYQRILQLVGDQPLAVACGAHLGLGKILYQWNDLEAAQQHTRIGVDLARGIDSTDAYAQGLLGLAQLELSVGDPATASAYVDEADQFVAQHGFPMRLPDVIEMKVKALLRQNRMKEAADLAQEHPFSSCRARVYLAQSELKAALKAVESYCKETESSGRKDKLLEAWILMSITRQMRGEIDQAQQALEEAVELAQQGRIIRAFTEEGVVMAQIIQRGKKRGLEPEYLEELLGSFDVDKIGEADPGASGVDQSGLIEPLSARELEVLELIAQGLTNKAVGERLFLSLNTVKVHTRNIYGKLGVNNRTQAVARSRDLGLLPLE